MEDQNQDNQKILINGVEYNTDEALNLIETGKATKEAEQKYNTTFDKVWPEYGKSQTHLKELETELAEARKQLEATKQQPSDGNSSNHASSQGLTDEQKQQARNLGVVFAEDLEKNGYLTQDKFQELFQETLKKQKAEEEAVQQVYKQADKLEQEINGSDGRPRFRRDHVMAYAAGYGIGSLEEAYEKMYAEELAHWKEDQIEAQKRPSLKTLRQSGGNKQPQKIAINRNNLNDLIHEAINQPEE